MISYSISYDLGDGTVTGNPTSYTIETETFTLNNPTVDRAGYQFGGWTGTGLSEKTLTVTIDKGSTGNREYTATFIPTIYTISYNSGGGVLSSNSPTSYTIESADFTITNPTREGYSFDGWSGTGLSKKTNTLTIPKGSTGNREYTANWRRLYAEFSVELNGGELDGDDSATYDADTRMFTLNTPHRKGYEFTGWNLEGNSEISLNVTIPQGSTENRKYIANWKAVEYSLSYQLNKGKVSPENPARYTIESKDLTLTNPSRAGYYFEGWTGTELNQKTQTVTIPSGSTGDRSYAANWSIIEYKLSYDLDGGTASPENPASYTIESKDIRLTQPTKLGYNFTGWSFDAEILLDVTIPEGSTGNRKYVANWKAITYRLNYDPNGGIISPDNPAYYTIESNDIRLTQPTKFGYDFAGWSFDVEVSSDITIPIGSTGDRQYFAKWTATVYNLSYDLDGGIASPDNPASYTIESEDIKLTRPTRLGYDFAGWSFDAEISLDVTIPAGSTGDREYFAIWTAINYSLSYDLDGGTLSQDNPLVYDITSADFKLSKPTKNYYTFTGWTGTGLDSASTDLVIPTGSTGNREYTAVWTAIRYTISYELNNGTVSGNPEQYTVESDDITLSNPTKEGYTFDGWSGTDLSGLTQTITIPKGSNGVRQYTANFTPIVYTITYHLDGGTVAGNPTSYTIETPTFKLNNPTKDGLIFAGWTGTGLTELTKEVTISQNSTGNREYTANYSEGSPYLYTEDTGQTGKTLSEVISNMSKAEKNAITTLKVDSHIENLSGLEEFTNLERLDLTEAYSLNNVDLRGDTRIKSVDISGNPAAQSLNLAGSSVENLDASGCDNLSTLDVSGCEGLKTLDVSSTKLANLNVKGCVNLEVLNCSECKLSELNISSCVALARLDCSNNNLYRLDVGRLSNLTELKCDNQARQLWNVGQSQAIHFLDFFHDDGVNGTGIANIMNVRFKIRDTGEILPADYDQFTGVAWFSVPLNGGSVITREDYPPEIYYDYVTGFQKAGSSSVSSAASETLMHVTIENTIEVPPKNDYCNAGMTFPMLVLVGLLLLRKR